MITDPDKTIRPYQLTGPGYAAWYKVGRTLGVFSQSAIATALCGGSGKLPENVDPYNGSRIVQIAAESGVLIRLR